MSMEHSALSGCPTGKACGKCFNNLVDPRGFTLMTTPKVATQSVYKMYKDSGPFQIRFSSKKFVQDHCKSHYKIGFIRNPFDRLVSCWMDKCVVNPVHRTWYLYGLRHKMTFDDFVKIICEVPHNEADKHWRMQSFDLYQERDQIPDILVRFEDINNDWDAARHQIEIRTRAKLGGLPYNNVSGHNPYQEYYTPQLVDLVGDYYHYDLVNFGYSFDDQLDLHMSSSAV